MSAETCLADAIIKDPTGARAVRLILNPCLSDTKRIELINSIYQLGIAIGREQAMRDFCDRLARFPPPDPSPIDVDPPCN